MSRKTFYEVPQSGYLFPALCQPTDNRAQPEEPVRQWCAHELIRAYGVAITEIEFERKVRVGSKIYRIDILVLRNGSPWFVVECKEQGHTKHDAGMAQAISYADVQGVQAEFVLYTNGHEWHVRRRVQQQWVAVADLPMPVGEGSVLITCLFQTIQEASPLLCKLDERLEGNEAQTFFRAMQVFFHGSNLLTQDCDQNLLNATDNLLRVLSSAGDLHYQFGKLGAAIVQFEQYRLAAGFRYEICQLTGHDPLRIEMIQLHASLMNMVEGSKDLKGCDALLIRVNTAVLEYGRGQSDSTPSYPQIGPSMHQALRDFLDYTLFVYLNVRLPDTLDHILIGDLRSYCYQAWQAQKRA